MEVVATVFVVAGLKAEVIIWIRVDVAIGCCVVGAAVRWGVIGNEVKLGIR